MPLFTVDELKTYLSITGTAEDEYLGQLVGAVNASVTKYLGRKIESVEGEVEYHSGTCRERLYLKHRPATAITGVYVDRGGYYGKAPGSPFGDDTRLTEGVDFVAESSSEDESNQSCLLRLWGGPHGGGSWEGGVGNIKVVYNHGYAEVPPNLKLACFMIATGIRKQRKNGVAYTSETLGSYTYTVLTGQGNPGSAMTEFLDAGGLLRPYREIRI